MESNEGSIQNDDGSTWVNLGVSGAAVETRWAWDEYASPLHGV
jgi:hypothetical protein